jgi:hypothetical protein
LKAENLQHEAEVEEGISSGAKGQFSWLPLRELKLRPRWCFFKELLEKQEWNWNCCQKDKQITYVMVQER